MNRFWQSWRSKFRSKHPAVLADGLWDVKDMLTDLPVFFSLSVCLTVNSDIKKQFFPACTHSMLVMTLMLMK